MSERCTCPSGSYGKKHTTACYEGWIAELQAECERLKSQLPESMQHCTIVFKECPHGHGWLSATNWVQHDCPWCEIAALKSWKESVLAEVGAKPDFTAGLSMIEILNCALGITAKERDWHKRNSEHLAAKLVEAQTIMREWLRDYGSSTDLSHKTRQALAQSPPQPLAGEQS